MPRAATSKPSDGAAAHTADPAVNTTIPLVKTRRLPSTSASRPAGTRNAANTMLYAFNTHDNDANELPENELRISGNATLTIVASRNASRAPSDATSKARLASNRRVSGAAAAAASLIPSGDVLPQQPSGTSQADRRGRCDRHGASSRSLVVVRR